MNEIAKTKLKEPIILFDEPEISLHPSYVDELSDAFLLFENTLQIIFSTHSARLTKNIITNSDAMYLYNITLDKKYTCVTKMKKFTQYSPESKYRVTDDHVNSYFSKAILFVEGETELEFFANPYLLLFFPYLKEVDVFEALAQKPILNIMLPQSTNANTPYLCLIDLDKAVDFDSGKRQLTLKGEYFKETNEKYMFRSKKDTAEYMVHLRKRIDAMAEKLRIHYNTVFYSCKDSNYISFFSAIHEYLLKYCIYTLNTTIEGSLINAQTYSYALEYLKEKNSELDFTQFGTYLSSLSKNDQLNVLRLVFNGKSDLLKNYKVIRKNLSTVDQSILEKVMIGKKTSGWVSDYIDNYFLSFLPEGTEKTYKSMVHYLETHEDMRSVIINNFKHDFLELYELFSRIYDII